MKAIWYAVLALVAIGCAGCDNMSTPTKDGDDPMTKTWCTPDGHANWIYAQGFNNSVAVPKLDANGKPVLCTAVATKEVSQ